jgi:hypothetical protein
MNLGREVSDRALINAGARWRADLPIDDSGFEAAG